MADTHLVDERPQRKGRVDAAGRRTARRFFAQRAATIALIWIAVLLFLALFGSLLTPHDPNAQELLAARTPPSGGHLLGQDELGRDVLSRLIVGTRVSLLAAVEAVGIAAGIGVPLGLIAGFRGRAFDAVIGTVNDGLMSVPGLVLALTFVAVLGPGLHTAMFAVGIIMIPRFFRVARAATKDVRNETYILAARATGCRTRRTVFKHVLPNALAPILVEVAIMLGSAIIAEASLSFLGLGVRPPTASWGSMLTNATSTASEAPFLVYPPGIVIALTVLAFLLVGDGLRHALGARRVPGVEMEL